MKLIIIIIIWFAMAGSLHFLAMVVWTLLSNIRTKNTELLKLGSDQNSVFDIIAVFYFYHDNESVMYSNCMYIHNNTHIKVL